MTRRRVALIVNPFASRVTEHSMAAVERALRRVADVTTLRTERPGHATELAAVLRGDLDAVVVFSGDGGFNEVLNGLRDPVPVGFVPGGGTNVLPRALGVPRDPVDAARAVARALDGGTVRRISLGRVNGRRFTFSAGIGLDAELIRRVDRRGRRSDGRRPGDAYVVWTVARLLWERRGRFEPELEIVGHGRAAFALVANADPYTFAGPLAVHAAPRARFELGLDLVAPRAVSPRVLPRLLAYALRGRGQASAADVLYGHDLDRIELRSGRPLPLQADGEDLGDVEHAVFEAERDAVAVLA
ncbi:MAG: diacylglycerol kinase family lipid kinase [Thermoleophilia bacterium]|nr:diacylglycerol kinase family lipid kinase [Thermoleophilia bacterium]